MVVLGEAGPTLPATSVAVTLMSFTPPVNARDVTVKVPSEATVVPIEVVAL
jgi:hypothetical protein